VGALLVWLGISLGVSPAWSQEARSPVRLTLDSGLEVIMLPEGTDHAGAVLELSLPAGPGLEPPGQEGLSPVLAHLWAGEIQAAMAVEPDDRRGARVWAESDRIALRLVSSPEALERDLGALVELLRRPELDPEAVRRARGRYAAFLDAQLLDPEMVGVRQFLELTSPTLPYGRQETPLGVRALTRQDVAAFHARVARPRGALLVVGSGMEASRLRAILERSLVAWGPAGPGSEAPVSSAPESASAGADGSEPVPIRLVHVPGQEEATVMVGHGVPSLATADWVALTLGVEIRAAATARTFAGWSRFLDHREPIASDGSLTRRREGSLVQFRARTTADDAPRTLQALLEGMDRGRRALPSPEEVEEAAERIGGTDPRALSLEERVGRVAAYEALGLGVERWWEGRELVRGIDGVDVREAMAFLDPSRAVVVVVGDATILAETLASHGAISIVDGRGDLVMGPEVTGGRALTPAGLGRPLDQGIWEYRVTLAGRDVGRMERRLEPASEDGAWMRSSSVLSVAGMRQEVTVEFRSHDLSLRDSSVLVEGDEGSEVTLLSAGGGRLRGVRRALDGTSELPVAGDLPSFSLAGDLLELALWGMDLEPGDRLDVPFVDLGSGTVSRALVEALGEAVITVPAGTFSTRVVEVVAASVRQRFFLLQDAPGATVAVEVAGRSIRMELLSGSGVR
jgi:zinc protease